MFIAGWQNAGGCPNHVTWNNAKDPTVVPYEHQFLCGSNLDDGNMAKNSEIICFRPDSSLDVLIVAPAMSFANASGGGYYYNKLPKAAIDRSGDYILWSSNLRSNRIDIFVARVPWHLLVAEEDYNPLPQEPESNSTPNGSNTPQTPTGSQQPVVETITSHGSAQSSTVVVVHAILLSILLLAWNNKTYFRLQIKARMKREVRLLKE